MGAAKSLEKDMKEEACRVVMAPRSISSSVPLKISEVPSVNTSFCGRDSETSYANANHSEILRGTSMATALVDLVCTYAKSSPDDLILVMFPPWKSACIVDRSHGLLASTAPPIGRIPRDVYETLRLTLEASPADRPSFVIVLQETSGLELALWTVGTTSIAIGDTASIKSDTASIKSDNASIRSDAASIRGVAAANGENRNGSWTTIGLAPYPDSHWIHFPFTDGRGKLYLVHGKPRSIRRWTGGLNWEPHTLASLHDPTFGLNWEHSAMWYRSHFAGCTVFFRHDTGALFWWNPTTGTADACNTPVTPPCMHVTFMNLANDGTLHVLSCSQRSINVAPNVATRVWSTKLAANADGRGGIVVCDPWVSRTIEGMPLTEYLCYDVTSYPTSGKLNDGRVFFANQYGHVRQNETRTGWIYAAASVMAALGLELMPIPNCKSNNPRLYV
jgi:hypothetical protein